MEDKDFGTDTDTVTVTVGNVAPIITLVFASPVPADEGQEVFLTATFRDPGALDTHTASVDWGDGTDPEDVPVGETHFIADIDRIAKRFRPSPAYWPGPPALSRSTRARLNWSILSNWTPATAS